MRGVALVGEYALCRQSFGWTDAMANTVATTSIDASFASADVKARLFGVLEDW
jgi:adenosine deaminase